MDADNTQVIIPMLETSIGGSAVCRAPPTGHYTSTKSPVLTVALALISAIIDNSSA
jgi:hypothetical protein